MPDTHSVLEPDGAGGWRIATIDGIRCARLAPSRANNRLVPPPWVSEGWQPDTIPLSDIEEPVDPDDPDGPREVVGQERMTPEHLVGKKFARDIDASPTPGEYERLGAWPDEPDEIDTDAWTATWVRPVIAADAVDPATHHAPVWDAANGIWIPGSEKTAQELADEVAAAAAAMRTAINAERERRIYLPIGQVDVAGDGSLMVEPDVRGAADRANLVAIHTRALQLHHAGVTQAVIKFGAADNLEYDLTPAQALALCAAAFDRASLFYQRARALKDGALATAASAEDLAAIGAIDPTDETHWT